MAEKSEKGFSFTVKVDSSAKSNKRGRKLHFSKNQESTSTSDSQTSDESPQLTQRKRKRGKITAKKKPVRRNPKKSRRTLEGSTKAQKIRHTTRARFHPKLVTNLVSYLSEEQKKWVQDAGFGSYLKFNFLDFDFGLAQKILMTVDPKDLKLRLDVGVIEIQEEDVEDVLGFPRGSKYINTTIKRDDILKFWRSQFNEQHIDLWKITPQMVLEKIHEGHEVTTEFKMNFLVLFTSCLMGSNTNAYVSQKILNFKDLDRCKDYNWCKYTLEMLRSSINAWNSNQTMVYFHGPLIFLILFYFDRVMYGGVRTVMKTKPIWIAWNDELLKQRTSDEERTNSFGKCLIRQKPMDREIVGRIENPPQFECNEYITPQPQSPLPQIHGHIPQSPQLTQNEGHRPQSPPQSQGHGDRAESHIDQTQLICGKSIEEACLHNFETAAMQLIQYISNFSGQVLACQAIIPGNARVIEVGGMVEKMLNSIIIPKQSVVNNPDNQNKAEVEIPLQDTAATSPNKEQEREPTSSIAEEQVNLEVSNTLSTNIDTAVIVTDEDATDGTINFSHNSNGKSAPTSGKGNVAKGGKGNKADDKKEPQPLKFYVDQQLPKNSNCIVDCEAAHILQEIHEKMVILSDDPAIKIPVPFDKGLQLAKSCTNYTDLQSVRQALRPLTKHGVHDSEIGIIANACPETVDQAFALLPSLKAKRSLLSEQIKEALNELAKLKKAK